MKWIDISATETESYSPLIFNGGNCESLPFSNIKKTLDLHFTGQLRQIILNKLRLYQQQLVLHFFFLLFNGIAFVQIIKDLVSLLIKLDQCCLIYMKIVISLCLLDWKKIT